MAAIDVLFERQGINPDEDKSLSDAISRYADHLVLGFQVVEEEGLIHHGLSPLIQTNAYLVSGSVNLEQDEDMDHRVRRISFGGNDAVGHYRSFAALTAEKYLVARPCRSRQVMCSSTIPTAHGRREQNWISGSSSRNGHGTEN